MKYFGRFLQVIYSLYGVIIFIAFLVLIFPLVVIASFFGKRESLFLMGIRIQYIYEGAVDPKKQYVFVFNHIAYLDIPFIMKAIRKQQFRVLGKAEMTRIPLFGFLYRNTVVLVDRNNAQARAKSVLQLKSVIRKGISIVISPEGTFNMTHQPLKEFYDGAFRIAIETQTPIKPMLFLDAYDLEGLTIKDVKDLKEKVYAIMEQKLIEYRASWIE